MTATLLKLVHIGAIAVWAAGLICIPFLNRQRNAVASRTQLHRLHSMVRFFYVVIVSPAAFIAIASGTALIFAQATFTLWFSLKLVLVGALVGLHLRTGHVLLRLFEPHVRWPMWRHTAMTLSTIVVATSIVTVVLTKPHLDASALGTEMFTPGRLKDLFRDEAPRERPDTFFGSRSEWRDTPNHASFARIDLRSEAVIEHEFAAVPPGQAGEDGREHRQTEPMRQDFFGRREPQSPIRAGDGHERESCDAMRPARDAAANAFDCEQLGDTDQRRRYAHAERETGAPHARAQEEWIAEEPIEQIDAERREH